MVTRVESPPSVIRTSPSFFVNSLLGAAIGVAVAHIVGQFALAIVAALNGRDPVLTNTGVVLRSSGSDLVLLAAPVASLILGLSLLLMYPGSKDRSAGRLVMLWTLLFLLRNAFVALPTGAVDESSPVGLAYARWDLPGGIELALAIVGVLALVLIAVGAAPAFLSFSRHKSEVNNWQARLRFASSIALIPGLAGPLLAAPVFLPDAGTGFVNNLPVAGSFVLITILTSTVTKSFSPPRIIEERFLSLGLVVSFVAVVLVVRFGLGPGIPIPPWTENLDLTWRP